MEKNTKIKVLRKKKGGYKKKDCSKKENIIKSKKGQSVGIIKKEDIKRILNYFEKEGDIEVLTIIIVALNTGLRISDVLELTFEELTLKKLVEKKTSKFKHLYFNTASIKAIERIKKYYKSKNIENYDKGYIFKSFRDLEKPFPYQTFSYYIQKVREKLNIKYPFHSHSFRKTWARSVYENSKKNIGLVMILLNHSVEAVTLRYIGIEDDDIRRAYESTSFGYR